jgi:co-chaperonin GroES (HSP10)
MSLPIIPREGAFIIERDVRPAESKVGSIYVQSQDDKLLSSGVVRGGDGVWVYGDHVYFSPYAGYTITLNGKTYIQMAEHEILGKFIVDAEVYVS